MSPTIILRREPLEIHTRAFKEEYWMEINSNLSLSFAQLTMTSFVFVLHNHIKAVRTTLERCSSTAKMTTHRFEHGIVPVALDPVSLVAVPTHQHFFGILASVEDCIKYTDAELSSDDGSDNENCNGFCSPLENVQGPQTALKLARFIFS